MKNTIPSVEEVQDALRRLSLKQIGRLAELSGVPAPTIVKIRYGDTENPGIETIRKFLRHMAEAAKFKVK